MPRVALPLAQQKQLVAYLGGAAVNEIAAAPANAAVSCALEGASAPG